MVAQAASPIKYHMVSIPPEYLRNYIPEARLFGDGRLVVASYHTSRTVRQAKLSPDQMRTLLGKFVNAGFFGWNDAYFSPLPYDNPITDYLTLNLLSGSKTVSSSMDSAPRVYKELFATLSSGADAAMSPLVPAEGTLMAVPTTDPAEDNWDAAGLQVDLSQTAQGVTITGADLQRAWELVNRDPFSPPPVSFKGKNYKI